MHAPDRPHRLQVIVAILAALIVAAAVSPSGLAGDRRPGLAPARAPRVAQPPVVSQAAPPTRPTTPRPSPVSWLPVLSSSPVIPSRAAADDPIPDCRLGDEPAQAGPGDDGVLAMVDTARRLPAGFVPPDLVATSRAGIRGGGLIRKVVIADLEKLAREARRVRIPLTVRSAYRSEARQQAVFASWAAQIGRKQALRVSARPGHSEHQLGTTIDFARGRVAPWTEDFDQTPTGRWLARHAHQFGFVMSYPDGEDSTTCYGFEPWHYRWIGRERAAAFNASGLTLRQWLWIEAR